MRCWENPPGPVTFTLAAVPPGRPLIVTVSDADSGLYPTEAPALAPATTLLFWVDGEGA